MPEREKAVMQLARVQTGGLSFNSIEGVAKIGPLGSQQSISYDEFDARFDNPYALMIDGINWNRVVLEATGRHLNKQIVDPAHRFDDLGDETCPECLCEALLVKRPWYPDEVIDRGQPASTDDQEGESRGDA